MASMPATSGTTPSGRPRKARWWSGFLADLPFGYERLYKRLHANVEWQEPAYRLWDPKDIEAWLGELRELGVPHCVFVDHDIEGQTALARFTRPRSRPINLYGTGKRSSLRARGLRVEPFRFEALEPEALCRDASVLLVALDNAHFNFLRERYLAKGIDFADGMYPYAVVLDGKLAGGFCLTRENTGRRDSIYLLSDFSVRRERRLAKLIAMLATSGDALQTGRAAAVAPVLESAHVGLHRQAGVDEVPRDLRARGAARRVSQLRERGPARAARGHLSGMV